MQLQAGLLGIGCIGRVVLEGALKSGCFKAENIIASDICTKQLETVAKLHKIKTTTDNAAVVKESGVIILAVKPNIIPDVVSQIRSLVDVNKLIISIAAGVTLKSLEQCLPHNTRVVRVMPNTPALIQLGASYISVGTHALPEDVELVSKIFNGVGISEVGKESLMDPITGVSGSGPAYVYTAIDAIADGGVKMGLPRALARRFAAQTVMGAAMMVLKDEKHPGELKDNVCSPGGTTIAALHMLEKGGFRSALIDAVEAATLRSKELGACQPHS